MGVDNILKEMKKHKGDFYSMRLNDLVNSQSYLLLGIKHKKDSHFYSYIGSQSILKETFEGTVLLDNGDGIVYAFVKVTGNLDYTLDKFKEIYDESPGSRKFITGKKAENELLKMEQMVNIIESLKTKSI